MKNEKKIRRMLGDKFHLNSDSEGNWRLYRYYHEPKVYFSSDNTVVMTNETNSEEELYTYLKTHQEWNMDVILNKTIFRMLLILWVLSVINIFIHNDILKTVNISSLIVIGIFALVKSFVSLHNDKVFFREIQENLERMKNENGE